MAKDSVFSMILQKNRVELSQLRKASDAWLFDQVVSMATAKNKRPEQFIRGDQRLKSSTIIPGKLYMYIYSPKHKETLPYYDIFPLVFPFRQVKGGFYGINLHYLPYQFRAKLFTALMDFSSMKKNESESKLKFSWAVVSNAAKYKLIQPCVKMYLYDHVKSPFKVVESGDWPTAMLLPVEQFQKKSSVQVWTESMRKVGL